MAKPGSNSAPRGRMVLQVRGPDGVLVAERRTRNIVLRGGARLIANLFAGAAGAKPVDAIGIGFAQNPGDAELLVLTPPDPAAGVPPEALRTPLPADSFTIAADLTGVVQVRVAARFKPSQDIKDVSEAGLLAGDLLYNQVIFEPVNLNDGQDVTLFWQIDFPFGH